MLIMIDCILHYLLIMSYYWQDLVLGEEGTAMKEKEKDLCSHEVWEDKN